MGGIGASYASSALPGEITLALDVAPTEAEYQTRATAAPIIVYSDTAVVYDKTIADTLVRLAAEHGIPTQRAVLGSYESDASNAESKGQPPRSALLGLPVLSTHGYEVMHRGALDNCVKLLTAYLQAAG
jgi:putative aminopeptidase FrvX